MTPERSHRGDDGFEVGDDVLLRIDEDWIAMLRQNAYADVNVRLLAKCLDLRDAGITHARAVITEVVIPMDERGYAHYAVQCSALGAGLGMEMGVDHADLDRPGATTALTRKESRSS